ncbi:MAG: hypothetical protein HC936_07295 [Leptolyngbyaceae cyanobacterium SU_3_3]|nr:hypothetical protein [Leptolyngbyaceae cyanobacterium SU_3_3]
MSDYSPNYLPEPVSNHSFDPPRVLNGLEYNLERFNQHQSESLQIHQQYLAHQMEYTKMYFQLMQQQHSLLANGQSSGLETLERSMMQFHQHQTEIVKTHERSLTHQIEYTRSHAQIIHQQYHLLTGLPIQAASPTPSQHEAVKETVKEPTTTSIASIVMPTSASNSTEAKPSVVTDSPNGSTVSKNGNGNGRGNGNGNGNGNGSANGFKYQDSTVTLAPEIVITPEPIAVSKAPPESIAVPETAPPPVVVAAPPEPAVNDDFAIVSEALLEIVSEKTGYPGEMLEMEMDMEADLGIDSIKRVEILGAMQERFPDAPKASAEELGELRTLGQIVGFMREMAEKKSPLLTV